MKGWFDLNDLIKKNKIYIYIYSHGVSLSAADLFKLHAQAGSVFALIKFFVCKNAFHTSKATEQKCKIFKQVTSPTQQATGRETGSGAQQM